jgi:hypothetical protein
MKTIITRAAGFVMFAGILALQVSPAFAQLGRSAFHPAAAACVRHLRHCLPNRACQLGLVYRRADRHVHLLRQRPGRNDVPQLVRSLIWTPRTASMSIRWRSD